MARKYTSPQIRAVQNRVTPLLKMEVSTKMNLAARIDDLIKERGWSKSEFAERLNKNPSEISRWLGGAHNFTIDTLCEIAVVFGTEVKDLFLESPSNVIIVHAEATMQAKPSPYRISGFYDAPGIAEPAAIYHVANVSSDHTYQFA